jgi:hypothetical protein
LSATIYTAAYVAAFQSNTVTFLLFLSLCPTAIAVVTAIFISRVPVEYIEHEPVVISPGQEGRPVADPANPDELSRKARSGLPKQTRFAIVYLIVMALALVRRGSERRYLIIHTVA